LIILLAARAWFYFGLKLAHDPWTYRYFPLELAFFLAGALAYRWFRRLRTIRLSRGALTAPVLIFITILVAFQFLPALEFRSVSATRWLFYLLAWTAIPVLFRWSSTNRLDRYIGELSYPLYVTHWMVAIVVSVSLRALGLNWSPAIPTLVFSLLLSALILRCVMDPIERLRRRRAESAETHRDTAQLALAPLAPAIS
jgi:peptidoglycan/LPS O-acetylase OafA/YrhL